MRLGVFGGSFDPIHYGHLLLAELCREACALDEVWFVPAATAPHKPSQAAASAAARLEMLELAIGGHLHFRASRIELDRGGVSYSVDTLGEIQRQQPGGELFLLMGSDSLAELPTWRDPERICQLATLLIVHRAGTPAAGSAPPAARWQVVEMPRIELSSREIRRRVAAELSIRFQTPRAVEKYIETHGLYRP